MRCNRIPRWPVSLVVISLTLASCSGRPPPGAVDEPDAGGTDAGTFAPEDAGWNGNEDGPDAGEEVPDAGMQEPDAGTLPAEYRVTLEPQETTLAVGATVRLEATVERVGGAPLDDPALTWSTSDPRVATVDSEGEVTAAGDAFGTATIAAVYSEDGRSWQGRAQVRVPRTHPEVTITAPMPGASLLEADEVTFEAVATDAEGGALTGDALEWTSDSSGALGTGSPLTVSELPLGVHQVTVTATDAEGISSSADVQVEIVPPPPLDLLALPGFQAAWLADAPSLAGLGAGDPVTSWEDAGGTFHVTGVSRTGGALPTYLPNAVNGHPAIRFDAKQEQHFVRQVSAGIPQVATSGLTIYAVVRHVNALAYSAFAPNRALLSQYNAGSASSQQYVFGVMDAFDPTRGGIHLRLRFDDNREVVVQSGYDIPYETWTVLTGRLRNGVAEGRANGVRLASAAATGTLRAPGSTAHLHLGSTAHGVNPWPGDIAAIYLYADGHDDPTVELVEDLLRTKYGLPAPAPLP